MKATTLSCSTIRLAMARAAAGSPPSSPKISLTGWPARPPRALTSALQALLAVMIGWTARPMTPLPVPSVPNRIGAFGPPVPGRVSGRAGRRGSGGVDRPAPGAAGAAPAPGPWATAAGPAPPADGDAVADGRAAPAPGALRLRGSSGGGAAPQASLLLAAPAHRWHGLPGRAAAHRGQERRAPERTVTARRAEAARALRRWPRAGRGRPATRSRPRGPPPAARPPRKRSAASPSCSPSPGPCTSLELRRGRVEPGLRPGGGLSATAAVERDSAPPVADSRAGSAREPQPGRQNGDGQRHGAAGPGGSADDSSPR